MTTKPESLAKDLWDQSEKNSEIKSTFLNFQGKSDGQSDTSTNLVPIHLRRQTSCSSLNIDGEVTSESSKSSASTSKTKSATRSSWWSVEDFSYPGIPFQVARYICETSPDLVDRMAATLHDTEEMKQSYSSFSSISSPLLHLSSTTDALSLQESVIDGRVSANNGSKRPSAHSVEVGLETVNNVNGYRQKVPSEATSTSHEKPPYSISIGSPRGEESAEISRENSRLELKSATSDFGSNCELDSNYELQSNISENSGFEEEMFRIKKLLLESPRTGNDEDSTQLQLDVLREKAALEGRVEALALELNQVINERAQLVGELNLTKAQLQTQVNATGRSFDTETTNALSKKLKESESKVRELEDVIQKLKIQLEMTSQEAIQARVEIKENDVEVEQLKTTLGELKVENELKEGAVRGLKSKVAELHVKLEGTLQSKSIVEGDLHACKTQVNTETEMKDWYRLQLQQTQAAKSKMQQEFIAVSALLAEAESAVEKARFERDQCRRNLAETQRNAVSEKEALLRRLESIEADVRERENTFKELREGATAVDQVIMNGVKKLDEERALLAEEKMVVSELNRQLEMAQLDSEMRLATIQKMETEAAQFMKQLTVLQKTVSEKELELHQAVEKYIEVEAKLREQQTTLTAKNEIISKLKQEKVALEVQLKSAREEKLEMDVVIGGMKDNVTKIDSRTRNMREELNQKNDSLRNFENENANLKEQVKKLIEDQDQLKSKLLSAQTKLSTVNEELEMRRQKEPRLQEAINRLSDQNTQIQGENALLNDKISILEKYNLSGNIQKLSIENGFKEEMILNADKENMKKCQRYESNIKVLTRKLREALKVKSSLEEELKQMKTQSNTVNNNESLNISKTKDAKITYYRKKLIAMEAKLNETVQQYEEERRRADKIQESLIELEKQKGKLHALADSSSALKQQTTHLETTLSVTEVTVSQLHQLNNELIMKKQQEEELLRDTVRDLQNKLVLEQEAVRDTKKQTFMEKCESNSLRKQLSSLKRALEDANRQLETKETLIAEMNTEMERKQLCVTQGTSDAAELRAALSKNKELVEKLQKEVEESRAKDPLLADQIKTLGWYLQQKKQELTRLQQQASLAKERHEEELSRMNEVLNRNQRELESLRGELQLTVKEKLTFQAKLSELRNAFKATLEKGRTQQNEIPLADSPSTCDENLISSLLQQSLPLPDCRPLSNLQVCVNTLKQEMAILQQQLLEPNGAV